MPKTRVLLTDRGGYSYYAHVCPQAGSSKSSRASIFQSVTFRIRKSENPTLASRVGDRIYPDFRYYTDSDYGELLEKVKNLELRSDDVLVVGYPKSGNNWVFELVNMIMAHKAEYTEQTLAGSIIDLKPPEDIDALKDSPSPRLFFSHLPCDNLPNQVEENHHHILSLHKCSRMKVPRWNNESVVEYFCPETALEARKILEKKPRIVFIVRNFKDMAVSSYHWSSVLRTYVTYRGKWEDYLDIELGDQCIFGGWFNHLKQVDQFISSHSEVPFHILFYERLKENLAEEIRKLCHFLQQPADLVEEMAKMLEFKAMKTLTKFKDWEQASCDPGAHFMRKGEVGDWRNHFSPEQNETTNRLIQEQLSNSPVADVLKPYMGL